jgi:DNA-binding NarL/FixJ family response regulator
MQMPADLIQPETKRLSKREWDCVKLCICGKTAKEVAKEFRISHRTVEKYLLQARCKYNSKNQAELFYKIITKLFKGNFSLGETL